MTTSLPRQNLFSPYQRVQLACISGLAGLLVSSINRTLKFVVEGWPHFSGFERRGKPVIYSFWHNQIFSATYFWRRRNIVVMTSQNFDGEYIARVIRRLGYGTARGSSSRGGVRALLELSRHLKRGRSVAFTIDGPRGPLYKVKPGPVWLSRKTGVPILPFHVEPRRFWALKSWDGFRIPRPGTSVLVKIGPPLLVDTDEEDGCWLGRYQQQMDALKSYCESYWSRRG